MSIFLRKIDSAVAVPVYTISENATASSRAARSSKLAALVAAVIGVACEDCTGAVELLGEDEAG
jgi:hypothetical protein